MTTTEHLVAQIVRLRKAGRTVQYIVHACGKTMVYVQRILEQQLGERSGKGRQK